MRPRLPLLLVVASLLGLAALPSPATSAVPTSTQRYRVTYTFAATIQGAQRFTDLEADGFCPGTGFAETAHVRFVVRGTLTLKFGIGSKGSRARATTSKSLGDWSQKGTVTATDAPCDKKQAVTCSGSNFRTGASSRVSVVGRGTHKRYLQFAAEVPALIREKVPATACRQTEDVGPAPLLLVGPTVAPYRAAYLPISYTGLAPGRTVTRNRPRHQARVPGYDVASCHRLSKCSATVKVTTDRLQVKRVG